MAGLVVAGLLLMGDAVGDAVRDVLDERAAERHGHQLLAAADAEDGHVPLKRAPEKSEFRGRTAFLQHHRLVAVALAIHRGVDVEGAAGDDERVQPVEPLGREARVVRQSDGQAAGLGHGRRVVLAQSIPGVAGPAARRLAIQRDADQRTARHPSKSDSAVLSLS